MNSTRFTPVLAFFLFTQVATAQAPDVKEVLAGSRAKYLSLQSYSDAGEVRSTSSIGGAGVLSSAQKSDSRTTFTIKLARPEMYRIEWDSAAGDQNNFFVHKGSVWSDGESRVIDTAGLKDQQPKDTEMAIAMATGVSGGTAHSIPSIFLDLDTNEISAMENPTLSGEEPIEGDTCYVVKSHGNRNGMVIDQTLWISKESKLIRQTRTDMSGTMDTPELSYADAKNALESMGKKATDEDIKALLDQMAAMEKMTASLGAQSHSSIETHREIKINEPMTASDFREKAKTDKP